MSGSIDNKSGKACLPETGDGGYISDIMQPRLLTPGKIIEAIFPPRCVFIRRTEDECLLADSESKAEGSRDNSVSEAESPPDELNWRRFIVSPDFTRVAVRSVLPDRPLVARPADPVSLPPGHHTTFFVSIPVWFRVEALHPGGETLFLQDIPSLVLSKSWFGQPDSGEPCYALKTRARHKLADLTDSLNRAVCFIKLVNHSAEMLQIERLCLRVPNLALYLAENGLLWCGDVRIDFSGSNNPMTVKHGKEPPAHAADPRLTSLPHSPEERTFREKLSGHVKSFVNFF